MEGPASRPPASRPSPAGGVELPPPTVVKLGGSLARDDTHDALLDTIATLAEVGHRLVIVPGGGAFADAVRRACDGPAVRSTAAHWMAILAMDQMAYLLAGRTAHSATRPDRVMHHQRSPSRSPEPLLPAGGGRKGDSRDHTQRVCVVRSAAGIARTLARGRVPILAPFRWLRAADPLPHLWDVTSDSIAAWLAAQLNARRLILLKSVDGIRSDCEKLLPAISRTLIKATADPRTEVVDRYFAHALAATTECWIINGRRPERLRALVEHDTTTGTVVC